MQTACDIAFLCDLFRRKRNLYLVGAGASYGLIPSITDQAREIMHVHRRSNTTFFDSDPANPTKECVLGELVKSGSEEVLRHYGWLDHMINPGPSPELARMCLDAVPASLVELMHMRLTLAPTFRVIPPAYLVFKRARPGVVATTNYDGLAARYCPGFGHVTIGLHGMLPPWLGSPDLDVLEERCVRFGEGFLPFVRKEIAARGDVVLPGPEHSVLTRRGAYECMIRLFPRTDALVIIGYSFNRTDENSAKDSETLACVGELLRTFPKPIVIIDTEPSRVAGTLEGTAPLGKVRCVSGSWPCLAVCMLMRLIPRKNPYIQ